MKNRSIYNFSKLCSGLLLYGLSCLLTAPVWAKPLHIFVSILPQKYFVERVAGELAQVSVMVQPGRSPETYEPTLKQMTQFSQVDAYIRIGLPFEDVWMSRLQQNNPQLRWLDARDTVQLRVLEAHDHGDKGAEHNAEQHQSAPDPHIWVAPLLVVKMVQQIQTLLSELDPPNAAIYAANAAAFQQDLQQLDQDIRSQLKGLEGQRFLVFHPSWSYFADAYGLQQIAIEREGKSPGAKSLQHLIVQAKAWGIRVVFVQRQFSQRDAKTVAQAIDGEVIAVDPLAENYVENLRETVRLFAHALR